jgi:hypothetical protein
MVSSSGTMEKHVPYLFSMTPARVKAQSPAARALAFAELPEAHRKVGAKLTLVKMLLLKA